MDCLLAQGVTTAFGVPGESYLAVLDALYDVPDRIRLVPNRQEGGAAFMAAAWGKLTGRPGIGFVTRGPGATNAAIGVHTARQDSSPMILFVGQVGTGMREREAFQEVDYRAVFGPLAKWATEIDDADRVPEIVARAFAVALTGRPGAGGGGAARGHADRRDRRPWPGRRCGSRRPRRRPRTSPRSPRLLDGAERAAGARRRRRLGRGRARGAARLRRGEPAAGGRRLPLTRTCSTTPARAMPATPASARRRRVRR